VEDSAQDSAEQLMTRRVRHVENDRSYVARSIRNALRDQHKKILEPYDENDERGLVDSTALSVEAASEGGPPDRYEWFVEHRSALVDALKDLCFGKELRLAIQGLDLFISRRGVAPSTARTRLFGPFCLDVEMREQGIALDDEEARKEL